MLLDGLSDQAGVDFSLNTYLGPDSHKIRFIGTALGNVISHEAGHLLIGMAGHSGGGLMRALWTQRELRRNEAADWKFSSDQAELMRRGLARGVRASN